MIQVEYLLLIENADAFCADAEAFNKLLDVDSRLRICDGTLTFEDQTKYRYEIQVGDVATKDQRYFQLSFSKEEEPSDSIVDAFAKMLGVVRAIAFRLSDNLEILRDDISTYYSELAYKRIHLIENLMRRLITNFMVVNVGANWIDESIPSPVKKALDGSKRKGWTSNILDEIDFIILSQYLLHPYCVGPSEKVFEELPNIKTLEELEAFKHRFELQSNWTRYFSEIVVCEEVFLKKRWSDLYDLRCKIAHNALVNKQDYERINRLTDELEKPLSLAIEKIQEVEVPEEELEQVVEQAENQQNVSKLIREHRVVLSAPTSQSMLDLNNNFSKSSQFALDLSNNFSKSSQFALDLNNNLSKSSQFALDLNNNLSKSSQFALDPNNNLSKPSQFALDLNNNLSKPSQFALDLNNNLSKPSQFALDLNNNLSKSPDLNSSNSPAKTEPPEQPTSENSDENNSVGSEERQKDGLQQNGQIPQTDDETTIRDDVSPAEEQGKNSSDE